MSYEEVSYTDYCIVRDEICVNPEVCGTSQKLKKNGQLIGFYPAKPKLCFNH